MQQITLPNRVLPLSKWVYSWSIQCVKRLQLVWRVGVLLSCCLWMLGWGLSSPSLALTQIKLSELSYEDCPAELSQGAITSGSSMAANCFIVTGKANNPTGRPVVNADIFGRVYDANNNPVMQNRTRLGSVDEIPPGVSDFELRITVPYDQPTPLKLEQFKASGFTGQVRR